jgi:hypothetical protein
MPCATALRRFPPVARRGWAGVVDQNINRRKLLGEAVDGVAVGKIGRDGADGHFVLFLNGGFHGIEIGCPCVKSAQDRNLPRELLATARPMHATRRRSTASLPLRFRSISFKIRDASDNFSVAQLCDFSIGIAEFLQDVLGMLTLLRDAGHHAGRRS